MTAFATEEEGRLVEDDRPIVEDCCFVGTSCDFVASVAFLLKVLFRELRRVIGAIMLL